MIEQHVDVNACDNDGQSCLLLAVFGGHTDVVRALVSAEADVKLQRNDGIFPLGLACQEGHIDIVIMLLKNSAVIEIRTDYGNTALWSAARSGHTDVDDALIARGADVNAVNYRRWSPVCAAAVEGHIDAVNTLLRHNANIRCEEGDCADPLINVALWGKHECEAMLRLLINKGAYVGTAKNNYNETALMDAVCSGRLDVVNVLVEYGDDIYYRDINNLQAVDIAGYCGYVDIVEFLRESSRNSSYNLRHFHYNRFPTSHLSCTRNACDCNTAMHLTTDVQRMRSLLENGAGVEAENVSGPIHCAVRTGLVELVELLIQHGANVDAADIYGNRPLHEAVCHGLDVVQLLVQRGAKMNVQNVDGKTPLHIAVERQQSDVIMYLLNEDADVALTDVWRNTPLHYLTTEQLTHDRLRECVIKQTKKYQHLLLRDAFDVTALSNMAACGIQDYLYHRQEISSAGIVTKEAGLCSKHLLQELQHIHTFSKTVVYCRHQSLVAKPVYIDRRGNTPLHRVVGVYGHLKMDRVSTDVTKTVDFLVKRGADINAQNNDGLTPLHVARGEEAKHANDQSFTTVDKRGRNFWHLIFLLRSQNEVELATNINHKMTPDASDAKYNVDDLNRTPLHYACMNRNAWIAERSWLAEEFIQKFSDEHIDKKDTFGRTALHYAAMAGKSELKELLKTKKADDMVRDNFENTAKQYSTIWFNYTVNDSLLRLSDTSSFVARNFRSIPVCVQRCFF